MPVRRWLFKQWLITWRENSPKPALKGFWVQNLTMTTNDRYGNKTSLACFVCFFLSVSVMHSWLRKAQLWKTKPVFRVLQDGALFYKKSGLGALPLALFNGVPLNSDEMDPDELEAVILQRIMDTTSTFQRAVFTVVTSVQKETRASFSAWQSSVIVELLHLNTRFFFGAFHKTISSLTGVFSLICPLSTGSVDRRLRCGGLSDGAGQRGSQDESSHSKHRPSVPRLHCQSRWPVVFVLTFPLFFRCLYSSPLCSSPLPPLSLTVVDDWEDATMFSYLDSRDKTAVMAKRMKYFTNRGKESQITFFVS